MNLLLKLSLFACLLLPMQSHALESLSMSETTQRSHLSVTGEMAHFVLGDQSLDTQGAQIQYSYSLYDNLRLEAFISTAFGGASGLSSSFFGFGGYGMYSVWGDCCQVRKSLSLNSKNLFIEQSPDTFSVLIGGGIDQYLLNGAKGVYSSSGFGLAASLIYPFASWSLRFNIKQSFLTASGQTIDATFAGAGAAFNF
jgi:hypothetical protein